MAQAEGEKELVLGNKQLISLFFVVVALCGVFFAMGYMMGRPSGKTVVATQDGSPPVTAPSTTASDTQPAAPPSETEPPGENQAPPGVEQPPPPSTGQTQPARDVPPAVAAAAPSPSPSPATSGSVTASVAAPVPAAPSVPEAGATYLQVTALRRTDADNLVKTLREQNLPALVADSSKPDLLRVLVGPYHKTADVADAKARLKALGFANAFVQK